jgi:predicted transcriptional regulator of viral defense system
MGSEHKAYNYIEDYLNKIRAKGGFLFTYQELMNAFSISPEALNQNLYRLKTRKYISQVKKGFYVILLPEYATQGVLPANLFIDDLMRSLNKKYYIGLLSAAAIHGASHQQPLEYFVVTTQPAIRKINTGRLAINFCVKKDWLPQAIFKKKTESGYINVSSPELTALDLFFYSKIISVNRALTLLQELQEEMKPSALGNIAHVFHQTSAIQRLGYLLEVQLGNEKLARSLFKVLENRNCYYVPLSAAGCKKGPTDRKWKIIINTNMESDL